MKLRVGDGKWPRVFGLEKVADGEPAGEAGAVGTGLSARNRSGDEFTNRLLCARTASILVSAMDMSPEEKIKRFFGLAGEMEKWVSYRCEGGVCSTARRVE